MVPSLVGAVVFIAVASVASPKSFLPFDHSYKRASSSALSDLHVLEDALEALRVMQAEYFQPWLGTWPSAIDWTAAVMGSHVSGAIASLSQGLELVRLDDNEGYRAKENLVTLYFSQLVGSYFGQDAFAIRNQAFDDMLWVVLGWLDTTQFIELHTALHYQTGSESVTGAHQEIPTILRNQTWHGNIWSPAFAHRARIFWHLAAKGWDETLCGGGMTWNPRLEPYKNAITNELFISASIAMYLHFPGDANTSPFGVTPDGNGPSLSDQGQNATGWKPHDPQYLHAALKAYTWLAQSGMINNQGLYTDGFHISRYGDKNNPNTKCDAREEMVYTYNQGVILTGQLGLFHVTGNTTFLSDGHRLVRSVISASGYDLESDQPIDDLSTLLPGQLPPWHGLGRGGILEEACDSRGDCSQDAHTFKGIFFHHFTAFCAPLEFISPPLSSQQFQQVKQAHAQACEAYAGWLRHNVMAALLTRDPAGKFGMWWTAGLLNITLDTLDVHDQQHVQPGVVDYRNYGVPDDPLWISTSSVTPRLDVSLDEQHSMRIERRVFDGQRKAATGDNRRQARDLDPNNRGRGRTVETQGGGLAVLRALWEVMR